MDKNYYVNLATIFEASNRSAQEINPTQQTIVDKGSDVVDGSMDQQDYLEGGTGQGQVTPDQMGNEMNPNIPMDDISYLNPQDFAAVRSNDVVSDVSDNMRMVKLCDLFYDLRNYEKKFTDSLRSIDLNLLDEDKIKIFWEYMKRVNKQTEKLEDYLKLRIGSDKYEKALYIYILLRTEFLTVVQKLRDLLGLNDPEEDKKETL